MQQLIEAGAYLEVLQLIENIVQSIQPVSNFAVPDLAVYSQCWKTELLQVQH